MDDMQLRSGAFREGGLVWSSPSPILDIWKTHSHRTVMMWFGNKNFCGSLTGAIDAQRGPCTRFSLGQARAKKCRLKTAPENILTVMVTLEGANMHRQCPLGSFTFTGACQCQLAPMTDAEKWQLTFAVTVLETFIFPTEQHA